MRVDHMSSLSGREQRARAELASHLAGEGAASQPAAEADVGQRTPAASVTGAK